MIYRKNLVAGTTLALFAIIYLYFSLEIKTFNGSGATPLDSRFMPQLWGSCLLFLSVLLILRGIKEKKLALKNVGESVRTTFSLKTVYFNNYEVILTFVAIGIYILLLKNVGFIIMTIVYIFAQVLILTPPKKKNLIAAFIVAIVFAIGLDYIFVNLLHVLLPKGILGF